MIDRYYAVFAWQGNQSWYQLRDCIGSRIFKTRPGAEKYAEKLNREALGANPDGYVARADDFFKADGTVIKGNRVSLANS